MQPRIVLTRPADQAATFAKELEDAFGGPLPTLIAPLIDIVPVEPKGTIDAPDHVIFTSANGVAQVDRLGIPKTAIAWCVGLQTAAAATTAGFTVKVADGDSAALVRMLTEAHPTGRIFHLRGAHVTGKIVEALRDAGLQCEARIVYDQVAIPASGALIAALGGSDPLIVPLFSPRSARLLAQTGPFYAPLTLVAISDAVAESASTIPAKTRITAKVPDKNAMIAATLGAFDALSDRKTP